MMRLKFLCAGALLFLLLAFAMVSYTDGSGPHHPGGTHPGQKSVHPPKGQPPKSQLPKVHPPKGQPPKVHPPHTIVKRFEVRRGIDGGGIIPGGPSGPIAPVQPAGPAWYVGQDPSSKELSDPSTSVADLMQAGFTVIVFGPGSNAAATAYLSGAGKSGY